MPLARPDPLPIRAVVHAGNLQRWMEQLCRLRHEPLRTVVSADHRFEPGRIPKDAAVYAFWWVGPLPKLACAARDLTLVGPGGRPIHVHFDDEWFGLGAEVPVPLYVGKTSAGLLQRLRGHLFLNVARSLPLGIGAVKGRAPTTTCQLRAGVDRLFPQVADTRALLLDNVALSYVLLPGDVHAANRFYLEDLAIGMMRPVLNVDVER